ncbi:3-hydroxyacyl-CoA dehydrogenase NAD-binding domain-containing protein, partial [Rhizobium ruizarguesonis]
QQIDGIVGMGDEEAFRMLHVALLTGAPLPPRGRLTFCETLEEAVAGADWVQESVPERLDLKRGVLNEINAVARPDALIGSSTSGLLPTDLQ